MKKTSKHNLILWLIILIGGIMAALLLLVVWVNNSLDRGTHVHPSASAYIYSYELTQTPTKPVSGRPMEFRFQIKQDGQPLRSHKVKIGVSHSYGIGIADRASDRLQGEAMTDENGVVVFSHTTQFNSFAPDGGFGVYAYPILTTEEEAELKRKESSGQVKRGINWAYTFDVTPIYPKWLGWFLWR